MRGGGLWQLGPSVTRRLAHGDKKTIVRSCFASEADLKKTVLYDFHVTHGGKMVPFAGWSMPIQYKDSIMDSTINCRENGSLFYVSHMCGLSLKGKDCVSFLEKLVIADVAGLAPGTGTLTVFTNEKGGRIDDSVITKVTNDHIYLVVNAGCRDKDLAHVEEHMKAFTSKGGDVSWHIHDVRSLLALQGPLAAPVLQHLTKEDLSKKYFSDFKVIAINGSTCFLTRTGYTGEDGFEISVPSEHAVDLAKAILDKSTINRVGSRDSLRLEAELCLYGSDMEQHITPVEAGLTWAIGKRRRAEGGFLGAEVILKQIEEGPSIRRVGFIFSGPPARSHSEIQDEKGQNIGEITSGGFSPCLKNIAMGYVKSGFHKPGTVKSTKNETRLQSSMLGNPGLNFGVLGIPKNVSFPNTFWCRRCFYSGPQAEVETGRTQRSTDYIEGSPREFGSSGFGRFLQYPNRIVEANADVVFIKLMRNNAFVTLTDSKGNKKLGISAGKLAGKGGKLARYSGEAAAEDIGQKVRQMKIKSVVVKVNGLTFFRKKKQAILGFKDGYSHSRADSHPVVYVEDTTRKPHNGCRRKKQLRI